MRINRQADRHTIAGENPTPATAFGGRGGVIKGFKRAVLYGCTRMTGAFHAHDTHFIQIVLLFFDELFLTDRITKLRRISVPRCIE